MGNILVVAEIQGGKIREASYELASFANELAAASGGEVMSLVLGSGVGAAAEEFSKKGGGKVFVADAEVLGNYNVDGFKAAIRAAADAADAELILISNTPAGWDVAPSIAAGLDAAFVGDCFKIDYVNGGFSFHRRVFNGKIDAEMSVTGDKIVATVQAGARPPFQGSTEGSTANLDVALDGLRAKFIEIKKSASTGVDLSKADVIVSGGRGVGAPEKFHEVIEPLAIALGGAMGASRPVVDAGWLPHSYQVGSSGQVVQPKLYVAVGISGAIQHLVGMKSSNYIIAINKDPDAPIFEVANLGVVADLFDIVPALTKAVQAAKG